MPEGAPVSKCRVCRGPAVIDLPRHNANFCAEHFLELCRRQVAKAIDDFDMLEPGDRVLVAVSRRQGQPGRVGPAARARLPRRRPVHRPRHRRLQRRVGDVRPALRRRARPDARSRSSCATSTATTSRPRPAATRRVPCSACGLSQAPPVRQGRARRRLRRASSPATTSTTRRRCCSATRCAGTSTTSPASCRCCRPRDGFPRKVKPLVRLTERETAAWCIVRGIDYLVEECPMAAGNKHLGYKAALNAIEARVAGQRRRRSTSASSSAWRRCSPARRRRAAAEVAAALRAVRRADDRRGVRLLPARRATASAHEPVPVELIVDAGAGDRRRSERAVRVRASKVLLLDSKQRRYLITLARGRRVPQPHRLRARTPTSSAGPRASSCARTKGAAVHRAAPDARGLRRRDAARRAGDLPEGPRADLHARRHRPGRARVRERRRLGRAVDDDAALGRRRSSATSCARTSPTGPAPTCAAFLGEDALERYQVELRDCYEGIDERDVDRVVLDLPEPWQVVPHAEEALRPGGILVAYTPSIIQAAQLREALAASALDRRPDARGAAPRLAHRGPGRAPRPPHGRPHRLPDRRPLPRAGSPARRDRCGDAATPIEACPRRPDAVSLGAIRAR